MKLHFIGRLVAAAKLVRLAPRLMVGFAIAVAFLATSLIHPAAAHAAPYEIQAGDTIKSIAADSGFDGIAPIVAANPAIADPDHIVAGQVIEVPDATPEVTPEPPAPPAEPQPAPTPELAPVADPAPAPAPVTHTVNPGDTLSKIASAYGVGSWHELWNANSQLSDPNRLNVGDVITIPTGPTAERALPEAAPAPAPSAPADAAPQADPAPEVAPASSGSKGDAIVAFARTQVEQGDGYRMGATGPNTWDCSSLVQASYASVGISIPRTSGPQGDLGTRVSMADARPGAIVAYSGHVAIYAGNGMMYAAANSADGLKFQKVYKDKGQMPEFRQVV